MNAAIHAVYWDILRKNRLVFPALGLLLCAGAGLSWAASSADPGATWPAQAKSLTVMAFLISILVGFAPFTLMESAGGWRMNSIATRWFALPMRTIHIVLFPLVAACLFLAALIGLWMVVLRRLEPGLDGVYFVAVVVAGQVAINALAWAVPRKPMQFWVGVGVLFPVLMVVALMPLDRPNSEEFRQFMLIPFSIVSVVLFLFAWMAAARNRCGAWPGEIPLDWLMRCARGGGKPRVGADFRSPFAALFRTESLPNLRMLALSWIALVATMFIYVSLVVRENPYQAYLALSFRLFSMLSINVLPVMGIIWMALWGLFGGGEPSVLFRSRMTSFRSTLPVSCGPLAGQKILMLMIGWGLIWSPLLGMTFFYDPTWSGIPNETALVARTVLCKWITAGAFVLVGALPVFLWGRFEGFPNFLLAGVCVWAVAWGVFGNLTLEPGESPGWRWGLMACVLALKLGAALAGFVLAICRGHANWKFAVIVFGGWLFLALSLGWWLPRWEENPLWNALRILALLPLARLAWCPVALAANRHR